MRIQNLAINILNKYYIKLLISLIVAIGISTFIMGYYPYKDSESMKFYSDVSMLSLDLETLSLKDAVSNKKTMVFNFLPKCPHCQASTPKLIELYNKYGTKVQFIGLSAGGRLSDVRWFKEEFKIPFPVYQDSAQTFSSRHNVKSYPAFVFTSGNDDISDIYSSYSKETDTMLEMSLKRMLGENPLSLLKPDTYYGAQVCGTCHIPEYTSWTMTHHSIAIYTLLESKKEADTNCVGCHVVGYQKTNGYKNIDKTPELANVSCEACHGPAGGHNLKDSEKSAYKSKTLSQKYEQTCRNCHDERHTLGFDFFKAVKVAAHYDNRKVKEVDWLIHRSKLIKGEIDRPLLSFPDGKIQGAEKCLSCHKNYEKNWKENPHNNAMMTLKEKGKDNDITCIKCHATLKDKTKPESIGLYSKSIECESCHGPGEAHVKSGGGKGNIVALTKSCPECVIEAVCTSCHTNEHDAKFSIEKSLQKVREQHKP